eukprot:398180-Pyramimonas_sp.AAC.1
MESSGKYLGVYLGSGGCAAYWVGPCQKLLNRVAHIRFLHCSLVHNLRACDVFELPVLLRIWQLHPPSDAVLKAEHTALQRLTASPRHAVPSQLLRNISSTGIRSEPRNLVCSSKAAIFRAAVHSRTFGDAMA